VGGDTAAAVVSPLPPALVAIHPSALILSLQLLPQKAAAPVPSESLPARPFAGLSSLFALAASIMFSRVVVTSRSRTVAVLHSSVSRCNAAIFLQFKPAVVLSSSQCASQNTPLHSCCLCCISHSHSWPCTDDLPSAAIAGFVLQCSAQAVAAAAAVVRSRCRILWWSWTGTR
jgi:hypothetical protein